MTKLQLIKVFHQFYYFNFGFFVTRLSFQILFTLFFHMFCKKLKVLYISWIQSVSLYDLPYFWIIDPVFVKDGVR